MRRVLAALLGVGVAISLTAIDATRAAATTGLSYCYRYPIGTVCIDLLSDGFYSIDGLYENTGSSPHTGHIDLYVNSKLAWQGVGVTVPQGQSHESQAIPVSDSDKVHASWVDKNGHHFVSPTKTW